MNTLTFKQYSTSGSSQLQERDLTKNTATTFTRDGDDFIASRFINSHLRSLTLKDIITIDKLENISSSITQLTDTNFELLATMGELDD